MSKAWDESFAHIATNQNAVAERGWGPLNYNLLLHPEIQLTSTSNLQTEANNNQPASSIPPSGLNLSQGITATLVDQVVQYSNLEDARNGIHLDKLACQRKETALEAISSNKRYTAGLHVAAGRYLLGPEVVDDQLKRKRHAEEVQSERENKKIDAHMALANKVYAIRSLNKQSAEWTVAQTKTMATWYK